MKKLDVKLDVSYDRRPENEVDSVELLFCIQAWHEMLNPGHHTLQLFEDGSGAIIAAANYPPFMSEYKERWPKEPLYRHKLVSFRSLQDFINKTRDALADKGIAVTDSKKN